MLQALLGTDRKKIAAAVAAGGGKALWITDAHSPADVAAALSATPSMFGEKRTVVFDRVCGNEMLRELLVPALPMLASSSDLFFVIEEKPDAALKKQLQKYATKVEQFDLAKKKEYPTVFKLADFLKKGDKKNLWVAYRREIAAGNAPEAIHGVLFWGAKQYLLAARSEKDTARARFLVASLAELPHQSRRRGEELEYALERFVLSSTPASA
ncbi:MAG TPA: hypothetical protein VN495_04380 [Candidatus Paceibacterota bacterium]|nr:hypothetical protein [Candidatus Paceibacterota bacterium]